MIVGAEGFCALKGESIARQFIADNHHAVGSVPDMDCGGSAILEEIALEHGSSIKDIDGRHGRIPAEKSGVREREQTGTIPQHSLANRPPKSGPVDVEIAVPVDGLDANTGGSRACTGDV